MWKKCEKMAKDNLNSLPKQPGGQISYKLPTNEFIPIWTNSSNFFLLIISICKNCGAVRIFGICCWRSLPTTERNGRKKSWYINYHNLDINVPQSVTVKIFQFEQENFKTQEYIPREYRGK